MSRVLSAEEGFEGSIACRFFRCIVAGGAVRSTVATPWGAGTNAMVSSTQRYNANENENRNYNYEWKSFLQEPEKPGIGGNRCIWRVGLTGVFLPKLALRPAVAFDVPHRVAIRIDRLTSHEIVCSGAVMRG